jgi:ribosome-associated translation inhibitor RaiA
MDRVSVGRSGPQVSHRVVTATFNGAVSALDWTYALDELRRVSDDAAPAGYCAHAHLTSEPVSHPRPLAIAECAVVLDGSSRVIVAGAVATTMQAAVDELTLRLRRRIGNASEFVSRAAHPVQHEGGNRHDRFR